MNASSFTASVSNLKSYAERYPLDGADEATTVQGGRAENALRAVVDGDTARYDELH